MESSTKVEEKQVTEKMEELKIQSSKLPYNTYKEYFDDSYKVSVESNY